MSNKKYFSYIRVSTQRQGQTGTSLSEQQAAINRFAATWNLQIVKHFEERETAAKQGRPVFLEMLKQLRRGKVHGVVIHKIDRSARNLRDWADLGSLIDSGIEVHFAAESLDLSSRGGRLSADIQAVVASDYIRNLREETIKGLYGRLKQGLFPFRAVVGYRDMGKAKAKVIDPISGPLVRKTFELYSTGDWGLIALVEEMYKLGLRNKSGRKVTKNGMSTLLRNPFYMGIIRIKKRNEMYPGIHEPIISKSLYDDVQKVLNGKNIRKTTKHFYVYRRCIQCENCGYNLIPEKQKGFIYYRCHTKNCLPNCLREEVITTSLLKQLKNLKMSDEDYSMLEARSQEAIAQMNNGNEQTKSDLILQQSRIKARQSNLVDAFMDGFIDKETFLTKKNDLDCAEQEIKEQLVKLESSTSDITSSSENYLELANSAYLSYKSATPEIQRELVKIITSNLSTNGKTIVIMLKKPFQMILERKPFTEW